MKKITLRIFEIYELKNELLGFTNQSSGEFKKGILQEKLPLVTKYWLSTLSDRITSEVDKVESIKKEYIQKIGIPDGSGNITILTRINEKYSESGELESFDHNPDFIQYQNDMNSLMLENVEIEYKPLSISDLAIETDVYPKILFKLVEAPQN